MNVLMTIQEAYNYLESLEVFGWQPGLQRIEALMEGLGHPEKNYQSVHVGGTNGKGSVTASMSKVLLSNDFKVGQFTSPELFEFRERIQLNGRYISEKDLILTLNKIIQVIDVMVEAGMEHPTQFEVTTALAFQYFSDQGVDFAVVEVGLGGAIDSTNVINPLLSIITNVSLDHKDYLGSTEEAIAGVKSGIIKAGVPVITGSDNIKVLEVLKKRAQEVSVENLYLNVDFMAEPIEIKEDKTIFKFTNEEGSLQVSYSLAGVHQVEKWSSCG